MRDEVARDAFIIEKCFLKHAEQCLSGVDRNSKEYTSSMTAFRNGYLFGIGDITIEETAYNESTD